MITLSSLKRIASLSAFCLLAACGATRPDMTTQEYTFVGLEAAISDACLQRGIISPGDYGEYRAILATYIAQRNIDNEMLARSVDGMQVLVKHRIAHGPEGVQEILQTGCGNVKARLAQIRSARAMQMHDAQIAAYRAQAEAASVAAMPNFSVPPITYTPPSAYQAPQVYTPQLGGGSNIINCRQLGSYVTSCR